MLSLAVVAALTLQTSKWTLVEKPPLSFWPDQLTGSLIEVKGFNAEFAEAVATIRLADGRVRGIPYKALDTTGKARVDAWLKANPGPKPSRSSNHVFKPGPYDPVKDAPSVKFKQTDHFCIHYGNKPGDDIKNLFANDEFINRNAQYLETIREFFRKDGAPMPGSQFNPPQKLNVYITGTGLKQHLDGFAFAAAEIVMHPSAMADGSTVVPHEFGHCIQLAAGGFRNSDLVGWFWECHANWCSQRYLPHEQPDIDGYAERAHYELNSSRMNYGSWPFLEVLANDPKLGPQFCYEIWTKNRKDSQDRSIEDPLETIVRVAKEKGAFPKGWSDFGDRIGTLAARMAGLDFEHQFSMERTIRGMEERVQGINRSRTGVDAVPDMDGKPTGWFAPWFSQAPRQFGYNLVDLEAQPNAKTVTVEFRPETDVPSADWRVTLVAIDSMGKSRYSETVRKGNVSLDRKPEDKRYVLAVAATPTTYIADKFRPGFGKKTRYPYAIRPLGAVPTPRLPKQPQGDFRPHPNGGGMVAVSAKVAPTAYVAPGAKVLEEAQVLDSARILDSAVVRGRAIVSEKATIAGSAVVFEEAKVSGEAIVHGGATISGSAHVKDRARVRDAISIIGDGVLQGDALAKGWGELHTSPKCTVGGVALIGEDSEIHLASSPIPKIESGLLYGFLSDDFFQNDVPTTNGMIADLTFGKAMTVSDKVADHQGVRHEGLGTRVDGSMLDAARWKLELTLDRSAATMPLLSLIAPGGTLKMSVDKDGVIRAGEHKFTQTLGKGRQTLIITGDAGRVWIGGSGTALPASAVRWLVFGDSVVRAKAWRLAPVKNR